MLFLAQKKYMTEHDRVGKVIQWELYKKFKFHHINKWYMHKLESIIENATHKILWDFEIKTDHLIPARKSDLVLICKKKSTYHLVDFAVPADFELKMLEIKKRDKYMDLARELKKQWYMKMTLIQIVDDAVEMVPKVLERRQEELEIRGRIKT